MCEKSVPIFLAFGNPLLDISVILEPENDCLLEKYNLNPNDEIEISKEKLESMLIDVSNSPNKIHYVPGGSAQNTTRLLRWILDVPKSTSYIGSVGRDEQGQKLEACNSADGVDTRYVIQEDKPTGVCVAFINGPNRSLAAHLGAAVDFKVEHLKKCQELHANTMTPVKIVYVEGFFITNRVQVVEHILQFCKTNKKLFVFNLNSEYLINSYGESMKHFAYECDILFGNVAQYLLLADLLEMNVEKTIENIALHICKQSKTSGTNKIVIVTDGSEPVICVSGDEQLIKYQVPEISPKDIVDTTGAGDSFVAGFLAGILNEKDLKTCLAWGCWLSRQIIQMIGCPTPKISPKEILSVKP